MEHLKLTQFPILPDYPMQSLRHQRGMTLVEWMVSMTVGLILLAALTTLIGQQSRTQAELEKSSRQIENGRYAMQLLNDDIQMAGYYGEFSNVASLPLPPGTSDACSTTAADLAALMAWPVQGYDWPSTTTVLPTCINAANHVPGTDILVVRRVQPDAPLTPALTPASAATAAGGQVYLQSGFTSSGLTFEKKLATGATTSEFNLQTQAKPATATAAAVTAKPALLREFIVHIYYVSPCSVMANTVTCASTDDGGKPIPTLKMLELSADSTTTRMKNISLVEGIENMQIDYGIDTNNDGAPDSLFVATTPPIATPTDPAQWANVVALRVHLLARNNESSQGYVNPKTYALGYSNAGAVQTVTPTTDLYGNNVRSYKRRLFSQLIRVVNPSSRRDK